MTYYHVPGKLDQKQLYKPGPDPRRPNGWFLVAHELPTERECMQRNAPINLLDRVQVSKRDVYFCFGARFIARGAKVVRVSDGLEVTAP